MITPPVAVNSGNWAGYEWNGSSVSASVFKVPEFPYKDMTSAEKNNHTVLSLWAGLGISPTIEQIGIYDYVQAGQVRWAGVCAFWPVVDEGCGQGISTGDEIAVSVHRTGLTYKLAMRDYGPHNVWAISITRTLDHVDTTAETMVEDSTYPGYPLTNLTWFSPVKVYTSGNPVTEYYSPWGYAVRNTSKQFTIYHR
jgi:hypothetical protein